MIHCQKLRMQVIFRYCMSMWWEMIVALQWYIHRRFVFVFSHFYYSVWYDRSGGGTAKKCFCLRWRSWGLWCSLFCGRQTANIIYVLWAFILCWWQRETVTPQQKQKRTEIVLFLLSWPDRRLQSVLAYCAWAQRYWSKFRCFALISEYWINDIIKVVIFRMPYR